MEEVSQGYIAYFFLQLLVSPFAAFSQTQAPVHDPKTKQPIALRTGEVFLINLFAFDRLLFSFSLC